MTITIIIALCFEQNNDLIKENNFDQNIMPYLTYMPFKTNMAANFYSVNEVRH